MAKYIAIRRGTDVAHIERIGHDFGIEDVIVLDEAPRYEAEEGRCGVLVCTEDGAVRYEYRDEEDDGEPSAGEEGSL